MKKEIRNYFLIFGNDPESDPKYWERDYVRLWQIIFGIIVLPLFIISWILKRIFGLKIY